MHKAPRCKSAVLPFGIKNKLKTELPALVALTAIGQPWFADQHRMDLLVVALVVDALAPAESVQAQCAGELVRLCSGVIDAASKTAIALNLAECLPWLQLQQNHQVERAIRSLASRPSLAVSGLPASHADREADDGALAALPALAAAGRRRHGGLAAVA